MAKHKSVADMLRNRVAASPDAEAFSFPDAEENWKSLNWTQVGARVRTIASGLRARGLAVEERVGLLCSTRVEWLLADLGINGAGGATTTIYPSTIAEDTQYILADSGSVVCIAEDDKQVAKLVEQRENLPDLKYVVVIDGTSGHDGWVISLDQLETEGKAYDAENPKAYDARIDELTPDNLATLIYTSGTTGKPKGVELTHDCWLYIGEALDEESIMGPEDKQFLWLPLSHSFGKMLEVAVVYIGVPTAVDGRIPKIIENLSVVRPTFMAAAPRIFEKVYNKVVSGAREAGGLKFKIFKWAMGVGREVSKTKQAGKEPAGMLAFKFSIADKLVFSKLRARFGGRVRFFISGSAPLNRDIAEFFHAAGLLILEGYGLTESSAASFVNRPKRNKFGTVGPPLNGTEVKIADDGEILFRSRGVMRGYYNLPEVTAETLIDGWLHTGDIGELDADGHLRITDRKKALIKTSGGKYVAPSHLEGNFKVICPLAGEVVVHGDARNFCSALIMLEPETIAGWAEQNGVAVERGDDNLPTPASYKKLTQDPKVTAEIQKGVDALNATLNRYETIKKFYIVPTVFSIEDGELTPSLKVKRKAVEKKYKAELDAFYVGAMADL